MAPMRFIQILILSFSMNSVALGQSFDFGGGMGSFPAPSMGGIPRTNIDLGNQWADPSAPRFQDDYVIDRREPSVDDVGPMDPPKGLPTPLDMVSTPSQPQAIATQPMHHIPEGLYPMGPDGSLSDPPNHPPREIDILAMANLDSDENFLIWDNLTEVDWDQIDAEDIDHCGELTNFTTFDFVAPFIDNTPSMEEAINIHTLWAKQRNCRAYDSVYSPEKENAFIRLVFLSDVDPLCIFYSSNDSRLDQLNAQSESEVKLLQALNSYLMSCGN